MIKKYLQLLSLIMICFYQQMKAQVHIAQNTFLTSSGNVFTVINSLNLENNGTINPSTGTLKFTGAASNITGTGLLNFYQLEVAKTNGVNLNLSRNIGVSQHVQFTSGLLNLNGYNVVLSPGAVLQNENETSRIIGSTGGYVATTVNLNAPSSSNAGNLGAIISSSQNLGSVIIQRGHQAQTNVDGGNSLMRYYDIQPANNSSLNATLRFNYFDAELNGNTESTLNLYKSTDNVNWTSQTFTSRDAASNYVEKTGINDFSRWTLRSSNGIIVCDKVFYRDADGDGYGNPAVSIGGCEVLIGYVANSTDCNDDPNNGGAAIHPGANEICNGIDDDCDGEIDEGVKTFYYPDEDRDGYGSIALSVFQCSPPANYTSIGGDCNDNNSAINPGAAEICGNGIDDNCNDQTDEGCPTANLSITINDIIVSESQGTAQLTVSLSAPSANPVSVSYRTVNGTAAHPKDYTRKTGEIVFNPGTTTQTILISLIADNKAEPNEYFDVELYTSIGAALGDNNGRVTITESLLTRVVTGKVTGDIEPADNSFDVKVSSNPTNTQFRLQVISNKESLINIQVSDVQGKIIERLQAKHPFQPIYLGAKYKTGVYFVQVIRGNERKTLKLIKF
jgi:hypothetical protein